MPKKKDLQQELDETKQALDAERNSHAISKQLAGKRIDSLELHLTNSDARILDLEQLLLAAQDSEHNAHEQLDKLNNDKKHTANLHLLLCTIANLATAAKELT